MAPDMFASLRAPGVLQSPGGQAMKSQRTKSLVRRSIVVAGRKTTVSLEQQFWEALKEIATERGSTLQSLVTSIKRERRNGNLSSKIRVYVLDHFRDQIAARTPSA
jgi:predicted DNA-binding ribbon-helix-helix protein